MLHWRQQGAAVSTIEICSLDTLKKEVNISPILKTQILFLAITISSAKQSLSKCCYSSLPSP